MSSTSDLPSVHGKRMLTFKARLTKCMPAIHIIPVRSLLTNIQSGPKVCAPKQHHVINNGFISNFDIRPPNITRRSIHVLFIAKLLEFDDDMK